MEELRERLTEEDVKGEFDLEDFLRQHKTPVFLGLIGLLFLGAGVLFFFKITQPEDKIEIISSERASSGTIFVDIEGAVEKPGVYELSFGARMEDLLIAAGGLSAEADREWVEKTLNRAQKLADGAKIYIPKRSEVRQSLDEGGQISGTSFSSGNGKVNINTASQKELEALWGVGPVTAQKIIENRPYQVVSDLLTKKILKSNVYQRISVQLTVY